MMSQSFEHLHRSPQSEFLVDTPDYQGISRQFEPLHGLVTKRLRRGESLQNQWLNETAICESIEQLFLTHTQLEIVLAGWIDQAVLEYRLIMQGDQNSLAKVLDQLDSYRPEQNGDLCFYQADLAYDQVLMTTFSFEDDTISSTRYQRKR